MYDFYFGDKENIENDPLKWLIGIKRMLPRFLNSIPDSEYVALYNALREIKSPVPPVLVETGCGASTIIMLEYALRYGGELYTWDICGAKLSCIRSVINDTLLKHYDQANLFSHWKYTAYDSTSPHAGITILNEMNKIVTGCFFDSEHTLETLLKELKITIDLMHDGGLVAIDDANYTYRHQNTAYINMIRTKHGLTPINDPQDNRCRPFYLEAEELLNINFNSVKQIDDSYKKDFQSDIFWSYYNLDRDIMARLSMEKKENLLHRFDAWMVK